MGGWTIVTTSPRQSQNLGRNLGNLVQGGEIVGLIGELGTGNTCFVRGFAQGIEVAAGAWVRSPTFTLINEYTGRCRCTTSTSTGSASSKNSTVSICASISMATA